MAYNNRFQKPPSNNLNPTRFAQNPTRAKSTRWTAAKAHNYDGDDWGDDDFEDDYPADNYSAPPPSQQYGSQGYSLSRSSTQPVSQGSYPRYETEADAPKPLTRQETLPAGPSNQPLAGSGIQRKPSKMDRDRVAQKATHHEHESVESPVVASPFPNAQIATSPVYYTPPASAHQIMSFHETAATTNDGYTTPTKQPSSPTQSPSKGSPTLRRPADIYAAAMRNSLDTPTITVDTGSSDPPETASGEQQQNGPEQLVINSAETPGSYEPIVQDAENADTKAPEVIAPTPTIIHTEQSPISPTSNENIGNRPTYDSPPRNSNLFLDINTDDDINRNIKLITPPPHQKSHFLTVPEPVQEPPQPVYDSDDDEDKLGLFHTSTPPRRHSLSPTMDFGFEQGKYHHEPHVESPVEDHQTSRQYGSQPAAEVALPRSEAASPSEYGSHSSSYHGSPINSSTPQPQSIGQKILGVTGLNLASNTFSTFVTNALNKDPNPEHNPDHSPPIIRNDSPAQQTREQPTSAASYAGAFAHPANPGTANQTPVIISENVASPQATQPENTPVQPTENLARLREVTPERFDEDDEVIIQEAQRGKWGMATHVAISQSPTKSPSQSPLATELSQPLITKATQPVIHTPQPSSSHIEQSAIIEIHPSSDRAVSPASHASSAQSKSPSLTAGVLPAQSADRRSPQPISFAEFIKRSPQSTPTAVSSSPPVASISQVPPPTSTAPVSFKAFVASRGNPMPEPERPTPPSSTPPAPSFKAFLSQKTPVGLVNPPDSQQAPINRAIVEPPAKIPQGEPISSRNGTSPPADEGEALRQAILKRLDAESQPQTPDTPDDHIKGVDTRFENPQAGPSALGTEPSSPIIGRNPSYKGKMPQRTASLISDVSDDQYRPQPFDNAQYPRYQKQEVVDAGKTYPPPPASDISAPSKSGDEGVFTPPARSVVGEQHQEYEPSIQEEPEYQPSITSDQYIPSPVDTVHPTKPFQMARDFNEIPTLLNLSDIQALSDSKDRIAASEKARKIHAHQGQQGTHELQVWLHHVQQITNQNAQLWTYNSSRPGMHDLRNNPLLSGRFDLLVQQSQGDHGKWTGWSRLDDGVAGSRPSTAASDDYMAPKKAKPVPTNTQPQGGQQIPQQSQDNRQFGAPAASQQNPSLAAANQQSQNPTQGQLPLVQDFAQSNAAKNPNQPGQVNGSHIEAPKHEEHHEDKKKGGLGKKLRGVFGRKKDKGGDSQPADTSSHPPQSAPQKSIPLPMPQQQQQQQPVQPVPLPQSEKFPPTIAQQVPNQPHQPHQSQQFAANGAKGPQDNSQPPPNKIALPKQDEFLPPLSFQQQGSKSPGLGAVLNIPNSNSVPDLRTRSQNQQQEVSKPHGPSNQDALGEPQNTVIPTGVRRPSTSGEGQGPPPLRKFDEDGPPPLRRISNSKPPPPRKRISSIPATVQEGVHPPSAYDPTQPPPRESQENSLRPGTAGGYQQQPGGQGLRPSHLQETSSGYEPSVSETSVASDHAGKRSKFSVFNKLKNSPASSSSAPGFNDTTGSPRHSIHTIASQPSASGPPSEKRRNSSFFQNQLKKFDQLVVGKERANEFHQQQAHQHQHQQSPLQNGQAGPGPQPEPGINRQQSFPVDGSNSIQPENKKKGQFASLISNLKTTDGKAGQAGHDDKKSRMPSFFSGGKSHSENTVAPPVQVTPAGGQSQNQGAGYPPGGGQVAQNQVPVYNPDQPVVVPIPGQYHSFSQASQIQSPNSGYVNGTAIPPNPAQQSPSQSVNGQAPTPLQSQTTQGIPPPPVPVQGPAMIRKVSNPPPPAARFLAVPPSPPPIAKRMDIGRAPPPEEESIYAPPVNVKPTSNQRQQTNDDGPPPLRPHQTSSPSPPPKIRYEPPPLPQTSKVQPVQDEFRRTPASEQPPVLQTLVFPEQESKVVSPVSKKSKEPEPTPSFSVQPTSFVVGDAVTSSPVQHIPQAPPPRVETLKEQPPRVEITPATATETEPVKSQPLAVQNVEVAPIMQAEPPKPKEQIVKHEEPVLPKEQPTPQGESSSNPVRPEPERVVSSGNEDYDKIAVDPEGVPEVQKKNEEDDDRVVMSATTMPGFGDWEYF
ncbi:hypothetical protein ABW20_dc0104925 [Dactylellina cionopaga]|nr:hypothetical protein ABW20_dc0104925 [Dactylellina cionopaga]